ncbi:2-methylcitrate dehydratase PrpD [Methylopila capsulata]|uniref:2-methylcitrate dehydratase PrpD n=1 Tax=Methylopila capsulata TaxID=61654 RepID=A0A9W6IWY1_9HYPH|nr:MmgE/PrpD family protein [Methylopila capsulata]MBM7852407.1 2-methylcitrate dehydratase PrpD [Methylopila capsulata]GLK56616.1 hypothetical protein GCM10008170_26350 [Methylopila capsulata]
MIDEFAFGPGAAEAAPTEASDLLTRAVSEFAVGFRLEQAPETVARRVKLHLLDTLGCAVAGRGLDISANARAFASRTGAGGTTRIFGAPGGFAAPAAAFANSVIANALDFDDGFEVAGKGMGHPGASLVTAAIAALADEPVSGSAFLAALIAAYEINNRLILAAQPTPRRFGEVYGIAQHQAIGAAIAYGRLSELDAPAMRNAIGLAGALTAVPSLHKYNWRARPIISLKDGVAPAARAGVEAVMMGRHGFVGSADLLDGPQGYWRMIGSDCFDPSTLVGGLGAEWFAGRGSFKLYPACRWLAPALEAFEDAWTAAGCPASEIALIEVETFSVIVDKLMEPRPVSPIDAQFSLPFAIGAIATRRAPGSDWYAAPAFADPLMASVARKVRATVDPEMDRLMSGATRRPSASVTLTTSDGSAFARRVNAPLGGEARPVDEATIVEKARRNLGGGAWRDAVDRLMRLEEEPDVRTLVELFFEAAETCDARRD